jgi:hypothetical protein
VVTPLGKVFFRAVASAFSRAHDSGLIIAWSSKDLPEPLLRLGVETEPGEVITLRAAAKAVAAKVQESLEVPLETLAELLGDDLTSRADQVEEWIGYLGLAEPELETILAALEFWDKHGADDQLMDLDDRWNPSLRGLRGQGMPTDEELMDAIEKFQERVAELQRTAGPSGTELGNIERIRQTAETITGAGDLTLVLSGYQEADRALSILEKYVGEAVDRVDHAVDRQIDIERGK